MNIRNIAIIAHVDHGKTTLVDKMLRQCNIFRANQEVRDCVLDSNDLERERGITILSKNISVKYRDVKINIIDTPGHADFGGEVERVLKMADGVLLLVDSFEGVMPQTRFVLQKAFSLELKPIIVINKMDRPNRRPRQVLNEITDLFIDLDASEEQLEFPVIYASGRAGWASLREDAEGDGLTPLLDAIIQFIPAPKRNDGPLQMQVSAINYSDYSGRIAVGKVFRGEIRVNDTVALLRRKGGVSRAQIKELYTFEGLEKRKTGIASCGDICAIVGMEELDIGDTIADIENPEPLPTIEIDEPTMSMSFIVNNSPFFGQEGRFVTGRHLRERLYREMKSNVAMRVEDTSSPDTMKVFGRGLLHLSILIENMRREGYEFQVGQPRVIFKEENGQRTEPVEELLIDTPVDTAGRVIETVSKKKGELAKIENVGGRNRLEFKIPSRGLIGLRNDLLNITSGEAVMYHRFYRYENFKGAIPRRQNGAIVSMQEGEVTAYALDNLQARGAFFVSPGDRVYEGQVLGEANREGDIVVNAQKAKKLTNMRASGSDDAVKIAPPIRMSLEEALEFINDDELVEVTPSSVRIRKAIRNELERKRAMNAKRDREAAAV